MYYRFEIISIIRQYPALFYPLIKINNRVRGLYWPAYIKKDTEFVIEGYFRSGNTFAVRAFSMSQHGPIKLAHHTHAIATVLLAIERDIPSLILLREPADTVVSATMKHPGTTLRQNLRWYIRYYQKIYELRESVYIALFSEVIQDFGRVIRNVNERFNTEFTPFSHTQESQRDVLAWIERMDRQIYHEDISRFSFPLHAKEKLKKSLHEQLEIESALLLKRADNLYRGIVKHRSSSKRNSTFLKRTLVRDDC